LPDEKEQPAAAAASSPAENPPQEQKFSLESLNHDVDSLSEQWAQLSAEDEQLQSLKDDLFKKPGRQPQSDEIAPIQAPDSEMDQEP
ncbi:MAG TPA: hypothetical protein DDZ90_19315, partial [Planctomycetaceae bacterium]|nr:hypothetical protein [Planctomycetaceae bacterium]